jgi:Zn-dependent protease with chaperone function
VHPLLGLSSVLLVVLAGAAVLGLLDRLDRFAALTASPWSHRRDLQFFVLAAPVISLALGIGSLHHFMGRTCFIAAPPWDYRLGVALPLWMGLVALGGLLVGAARLTLMVWVMARRGVPAGDGLRSEVQALAGRLGVATPRVRLYASVRPLALTYGLVRPTILLSTWMVERLDRAELASVLAHELGHVARRDYLVILLATMLRDAFFYLPTSQAAFRRLQREKELACDDLAVGATRRPLALASALAKVWQQSLGGPPVGIAQSLSTPGEAIEGRIARLLQAPEPRVQASHPRAVAHGVGVVGLGGLLLVQGANIAVILAPMGCGPSSPLGKLV